MKYVTQDDVIAMLGTRSHSVMSVPHFTMDAAGIECAKQAYGEGGQLTRMVTDRIHEAAAEEFGRLLGPILEDWFS